VAGGVGPPARRPSPGTWVVALFSPGVVRATATDRGSAVIGSQGGVGGVGRPTRLSTGDVTRAPAAKCGGRGGAE
jgi:hypothetical protein